MTFNEMADAFEELLDMEEYSQDATIIQITQKIVDGIPQTNKAGDAINNDPVEIGVKCRLISKNEYEKTAFGKITIKGSYVIGLFKFSDAQYLDSDNKLKAIDPETSKLTEYDIKKVNKANGHYEVILV